MGEDIILDAICYVPYLIDFILEYKEPLVNRERKVKELFKTLMMMKKRRRGRNRR